MNDIDHEGWHATHAQLLKSVADAQAKLLAGINEIADTKINALSGRLDSILAWHATRDQLLKSVSDRLDTFVGRFEAMLTGLAKPRRQVERLRTKRIVKRATPERKRGR